MEFSLDGGDASEVEAASEATLVPRLTSPYLAINGAAALASGPGSIPGQSVNLLVRWFSYNRDVVMVGTDPGGLCM